MRAFDHIRLKFATPLAMGIYTHLFGKKLGAWENHGYQLGPPVHINFELFNHAVSEAIIGGIIKK
jgi:hypothetical protein